MVDNFWDRYEAWQREALEEAEELFPIFKGEKFVVSETGQVFINGFINTPAGTVTPWEKSKYYMEV